MSDTESASAAPHPALGGKTLQSLEQPGSPRERPPYKSWRKKYRKMHFRFSFALDENKRLFKEEQKLEFIAKRLREDLEYVLAIHQHL